jgi:hypothetical protein
MITQDQSRARGLRLLSLGMGEAEYRRTYGPLCSEALSIVSKRFEGQCAPVCDAAKPALAFNIASLMPPAKILKPDTIQASKDGGNFKAKVDRADGRARTLAMCLECLTEGTKTSPEIARKIGRTTNAVVQALSRAKKDGVACLKSTTIRERVFWFLDGAS